MLFLVASDWLIVWFSDLIANKWCRIIVLNNSALLWMKQLKGRKKMQT